MSNNDKTKSKFFNFKKKSSPNEIEISDYLGWNSLIIVKFKILKNKTFDNIIIDLNYPELKNKQLLDMQYHNCNLYSL